MKLFTSIFFMIKNMVVLGTSIYVLFPKEGVNAMDLTIPVEN